jgi:hypothetical protein
MAHDVTHHQARGTSHNHLCANGRQRCQPPCTRPTRGVHAQCPGGHTMCPQPARRLGFNGIHPAPIPTPHATAAHLPPNTTGASDGIDPAGGRAGSAQAGGDVTHATIPRVGVCSCAMATPPRGRRERRRGAAGGGDAAQSGHGEPATGRLNRRGGGGVVAQSRGATGGGRRALRICTARARPCQHSAAAHTQAGL